MTHATVHASNDSGLLVEYATHGTVVEVSSLEEIKDGELGGASSNWVDCLNFDCRLPVAFVLLSMMYPYQ